MQIDATDVGVMAIRCSILGAGGRQAAVEEVSEEARARAVAAGASPGSVDVVEVEEIPLAYLTNPAVRIRVKAAGPLDVGERS